MRVNQKNTDGPCNFSIVNITIGIMSLLLFAFLLEFLIWVRVSPQIHELPQDFPHVQTNKVIASEAVAKIIEIEHPAVNELDQMGSIHEKDVVKPEAHGAHEHLESHIITTATFYEGKNCEGEIKMVVYSNHTEKNCENCFDLCGKKFPDTKTDMHAKLGSVKVEGVHEMNIYSQCAGSYKYDAPEYQSTIFPFDGCVSTWHSHQITHVKFADDSTKIVQPSAMLGHGDYRVVYSGESSKYMGYQARANYWGFLKSGQTNAAHTRLVTMHEADDLVDFLPTFWGKRHPFSRRYGPLNKPDVLTKWFASPNAPKEEVVVLIDPDNWLTNDISHIVKEVKKGAAIAQTAWFGGSHLVKELYKEMCTVCNDFVDYVAVPIFIHKDDLKAIAPLWKAFVIKIKTRVDEDPAFKRRYAGIQIDWGGEMHAYIFAAAELGIRHETRHGLQVRDVDPVPDAKRASSMLMIHMGRAWMPNDYPPAERWRHTEGKSWAYRGIQVWCKCNVTAADVMPWPLPDNLDFQSNVTLRYLHDSGELFELTDSKFRSKNYHLSYP